MRTVPTRTLNTEILMKIFYLLNAFEDPLESSDDRMHPFHQPHQSVSKGTQRRSPASGDPDKYTKQGAEEWRVVFPILDVTQTRKNCDLGCGIDVSR